MVNIICNSENLHVYSLKSGTQQGCHYHLYYYSSLIWSPIQWNKARKTKLNNWKERDKTLIT